LTAANRRLEKNRESMHFIEIESVVIEDIHNCNMFPYQLLAIDFLLNKQGLKIIFIYYIKIIFIYYMYYYMYILYYIYFYITINFFVNK